MFQTLQSKKMITVVMTIALLLVPIIIGYSIFRVTTQMIDRETQHLSLEHEQYKNNLFKKLLLTQLEEQELSARAIAVYDLVDRDYIYTKNINTTLGIASLTKIMTALYALETYDPETVITISPEAIAQTGESLFTTGQRWNIKTLVDIMLMASSNDGAYAIAQHHPDFLRQLAVRLNEWGMKTTSIKNATGLDEGESLGAESSAADMVQLIQYIYDTRPQLFADGLAVARRIFADNQGKEYAAVHTHEGIERIPHILFSKTGYTARADGSIVGVLQEPDHHPLVVVILGASFDGRFAIMDTIAHHITSTHSLVYQTPFITK